jgi:hypothetical protein
MKINMKQKKTGTLSFVPLLLAGILFAGSSFLQAGGIHPSYDLIELRPQDFNILGVGGMDFLPDGRLVIGEFGHCNADADGRVWIVSGITDAVDPDDVTYDVIAEGLRETLGIKVIDGVIYVLQDHELSKLTSTDATAELVTVATGWDNSKGNNWTMGLDYRDGYLHFTTGNWNYNGEFPDRGCWMRSALNAAEPDGNFECLASGLRSTNSMFLGPENELFTCDNQGNYNPTNRVWNLRPGRNYGFKSNTGSPFFFEPVSLAVAYVPHNVAANALAEGIFVRSGMYTGQLLIGDTTRGGIMRYFLERMNGEYQSAVFTFCNAVFEGVDAFGATNADGELDAGVNRLEFGPDGDLYIGGLGAGGKTSPNGPSGWAGNWSWEGTWNGLQKLHYNGTVTFEMLAIRSLADGFEIEFTKPVGPGGESAGSYVLSSWHNTPVEDYGGGAGEDMHGLIVQSVTLSQDRKKVKLMVDPDSFRPHDDWVQKASTVRFKLNGVQSQEGEDPWTPEAWYFVNTMGPADILGCTEPGDIAYNQNAVYDDGLQCQGTLAVNPSLVENGPGNFSVRKTGHGEIEVTTSLQKPYHLEIKDINGVLIQSLKGNVPGIHHISSNDFSRGMYIISLESAGNSFSKQFVIY